MKEPSPRMQRREWLILTAIVVLALAIRLYAAAQPRVAWGDEPIHLWTGQSLLDGTGYNAWGYSGAHTPPLFAVAAAGLAPLVGGLLNASNLVYVVAGSLLGRHSGRGLAYSAGLRQTARRSLPGHRRLGNPAAAPTRLSIGSVASPAGVALSDDSRKHWHSRGDLRVDPVTRFGVSAASRRRDSDRPAGAARRRPRATCRAPGSRQPR